MGKKKIEVFAKIADKNSRNITYNKRKKGLVKKAMELSILCEQDVYLAIFDKTKNKLVLYTSKEDFEPTNILSLQKQLEDDENHEHFDNDDYDLFNENSIPYINVEKTHLGRKRALKPRQDSTLTTKKPKVSEKQENLDS